MWCATVQRATNVVASRTIDTHLYPTTAIKLSIDLPSRPSTSERNWTCLWASCVVLSSIGESAKHMESIRFLLFAGKAKTMSTQWTSGFVYQSNTRAKLSGSTRYILLLILVMTFDNFPFIIFKLMNLYFIRSLMTGISTFANGQTAWTMYDILRKILCTFAMLKIVEIVSWLWLFPFILRLSNSVSCFCWMCCTKLEYPSLFWNRFVLNLQVHVWDPLSSHSKS